MSKIVCLDAYIYWNNTFFAHRNEASISFDVDIAEAKQFVASKAAAWVEKEATWKSASVTLNGFYDDTDHTMITNAISGNSAWVHIYPSRSDMTTYWYGKVVVSSFEHSITTEDYSQINIEAEASGSFGFYT